MAEAEVDAAQVEAAPKNGKPARKGAAARQRAAQDDGNVGQVLRTVYQRTVDEDIPSEMLDLLSKLG